MTELMQGYTLKRDLCLIGSAGSGKSRLVEQFCKELKQKPTLVNCYRDMSARDLLLKRTTDDNGSTIWEMSPLLKGALNGEIVILDGIHRLESDTLAVLHSLVTHREIDLADGRRLLRHDRFDNIQAVGGNKFEANSDGVGSSNNTVFDRSGDDILRVHPSFRIIALGNPSSRDNGNGSEDWMSAEILTMFNFVHLSKPSNKSVTHILENISNYGTQNIGYNHLRMKGWSQFQNRYDIIFERYYYMNDPNIRVLRFSDIAGMTSMIEKSIKYQIELKNKIDGSTNNPILAIELIKLIFD